MEEVGLDDGGRLEDEGRPGRDPPWRADVVVVARSTEVLVRMRYLVARVARELRELWDD